MLFWKGAGRGDKVLGLDIHLKCWKSWLWITPEAVGILPYESSSSNSPGLWIVRPNVYVTHIKNPIGRWKLQKKKTATSQVYGCWSGKILEKIYSGDWRRHLKKCMLAVKSTLGCWNGQMSSYGNVLTAVIQFLNRQTFFFFFGWPVSKMQCMLC